MASRNPDYNSPDFDTYKPKIHFGSRPPQEVTNRLVEDIRDFGIYAEFTGSAPCTDSKGDKVSPKEIADNYKLEHGHRSIDDYVKMRAYDEGADVVWVQFTDVQTRNIKAEDGRTKAYVDGFVIAVGMLYRNKSKD